MENMRATAVGSSASAPSPYTVSVGNATVRNARSSSEARRKAAVVSFDVISGAFDKNAMVEGSDLMISVLCAIVGKSFVKQFVGLGESGFLCRTLLTLFIHYS